MYQNPVLKVIFDFQKYVGNCDVSKASEKFRYLRKTLFTEKEKQRRKTVRRLPANNSDNVVKINRNKL